MADPNEEIQQEIAVLEARYARIDDFSNKAIGSFLHSSDVGQLQERLFEIAFCRAASAGINGQLTRLGRYSDYGDSQDMMVDFQKELDDITQEGDWALAKQRLRNDLTDLPLTYDEADDYGLPHDFTVEGVSIFGMTDAYPGKTGDFGSVARANAWDKLVKTQLALVPDKTDKWQHPRMAQLTKQVAG